MIEKIKEILKGDNKILSKIYDDIYEYVDYDLCLLIQIYKNKKNIDYMRFYKISYSDENKEVLFKVVGQVPFYIIDDVIKQFKTIVSCQQ